MPTPERPLANVQEAMSQAEGRVNAGKMDIDAGTKLQIMNTENDIKKMIARYKQVGVYEDVQEQFNEKQASAFLSSDGVRNYEVNVAIGNPDQTDSPEIRLHNMAFQFQRYRNKVESEVEGEMLQVLATSTAAQLSELKTQLAAASGDAAEQRARYEETIQPFADVLYKPENISDTLTNIGEMLGQEPNVDKMVAYESENDVLLDELTKPQNSKKMMAANMEFSSITGLRLDEIKGAVMGKLLKVRSDIAYMADKTQARRIFTEAYSSALSVMKIQNEVQTNVLFNEAHASLEQSVTLHEGAEKEGELMTEEEMAMMLDLIVNGSKDPSFFQQVMDVKSAFDTYVRGLSRWSKKLTGTDVVEWAKENLPQGMQDAARWYFSTVTSLDQGIINGVAGTVTGTVHFFAHPVDSLKALAHMPGLAWENRAKIDQMLRYGWDNTSGLEKSMLIAELSGNVLGGVLATAGVGAAASGLTKVPALQSTLGKATSLMQKSGTLVGGNAMKLALLTAEAAMARLPSLVKYGNTAAKAVEGMAHRAHALAHKAEHLAHKLEHYAHHAVHETEKAYHYGHVAEDATAGALKKEVARNTPTYRQIDELTGDIKLASANSEELGLTAQEIAQLQESLAQLDALNLKAA